MIENDISIPSDSDLLSSALSFDDQLPSENLQDAAEDISLGRGTYSIGTDPGEDENEQNFYGEDEAPRWWPSAE